ncbi:uncharacterized protein PHALS_02950 [Plasmopara halstedii]|uniref:Uncharacterized protein n=1 Tax=Plasmopara halstedii TaxID=4781 RepID=A0A0P1AXN4_PLAHL|nr:uncharacterized protein PHALS_02950 [Plasmopara halstedii]CEG46551.1 hypothetical protein PHALS_02950 [Plasmopara halstedii]|eukprot:XP_024582920.1 hypothetical protein PHALS_02950 [Plasmopara halstedii]
MRNDSFFLAAPGPKAEEEDSFRSLRTDGEVESVARRFSKFYTLILEISLRFFENPLLLHYSDMQ